MSALLEGSLALPSWFDALVISLLAIGFPLTVLFSWMYELTPEGLKATADVPEGASINTKTGRRLDVAILVGVVLAAGLVVIDRLMPEAPAAPRSAAAGSATAHTQHKEPSKDRASAASIAVLPFADLSPEGNQAYFSDGIAEEILNVLARIEGLKVASRTSSFQFRGGGEGVPAIAQELGVRHILEGSVRKAGETVRITAQLIDAETDAHLWSETFDRPLSTDNVFAIQDEIANAIVDALRGKVGGGAPAAVVNREADTQNLDAYELYLKAWSLFVARGRENLIAATDALGRAIEIDPEYARAHELLSAVYAIAWNWGIRDRDYDPLAIAEAETALKLNPDLAQPFATRGFVGKTMLLTDDSYSWEETLADLDEAVRRDPLSPTAWFWRGLHYFDLGFFDKAIADMSECFRLDPAYQNCRRFAAMAQLHAGRPDQAIALFEAGLSEGFSNANLPFADVYARRGETAAANALLLLTFPDAPDLVKPLFAAMAGLPLAERERQAALARLVDLDEMGVDNATARYYLKDYAGVAAAPHPLSGPDFHWYRGDKVWLKSPERKSLIRRLRLPEYWREHGFPPQCRPISAKNGGKDDFECK